MLWILVNPQRACAWGLGQSKARMRITDRACAHDIRAESKVLARQCFLHECWWTDMIKILLEARWTLWADQEPLTSIVIWLRKHKQPWLSCRDTKISTAIVHLVYSLQKMKVILSLLCLYLWQVQYRHCTTAKNLNWDNFIRKQSPPTSSLVTENSWYHPNATCNAVLFISRITQHRHHSIASWVSFSENSRQWL